MNRAYRTIWNECSCTWVAVAEISRAHHKRSGGVTLAAVASALLMAVGAHAQGVPSVSVSSGNTRAYVAPNGVTVVDIATANAAGLSHNQYTQYDVNPSGLVLNNGNSSQMVRQSQLAGQVTANLNLNKEASVILNEVVANNRSTLAGYTEVLGGKADVVLANPYGITCSGCGFINTDRATLTTGVPMLNPDGSLKGFSVNQGDILIQGNGLDGSAQQVLDLVSRSVKIDGQINALDLGIAAGANVWDYASRSVTGAATASGATPSYAIDSSALGGMYANRIKLVATDAGVGVRMLGDAATGAGDFALSAAGKIELQNNVSAQRDIHVQTTDTDANALTLTNTSLTSTGGTVLSTSGGAVLNGGAVVAGGDLSVTATSLIDRATSSSVANNNQRHSDGSLTLKVGGDAQLAGTGWGSAGNWSGQFGNLTTGANSLLYSSGGTLVASADNGNLALDAAALRSAGDLTLSASGSIGTASGAGQGVQSTTGNIAMTAGNGLNNAGVVSADAGSVTIRANGILANSGQLHAGGSIDIADGNGNDTEAIDNKGMLLAGQALSMKATTISNAAGARVQANVGSTIATGSLDNDGILTLSQQVGAADQLVVSGTLNNNGTLQSGGDATLTAQQITNGGTLLAAGNLAATGTGGIVNSATMQAGNLLNLQSGGAITSGAAAVIKANAIGISSNGLTNAGAITADSGNATLRVDGTLDNSGRIQSAQQLNVADGSGGGTEIINNSGTLQSVGASTLTADQIVNSKEILVGGDLSAVVATKLENQANGVIQSGGVLKIDGGSTATLANAGGGELLGNGLAISGASLTNAGTIQGGTRNDSTVTLASTLDNQSTGVLTLATAATGAGSVTADTITNAGTLQSGGALTLNIGTGNLSSSGSTLAVGDLTLQGRAGNAYTATISSGQLQSSGELTVSGSGSTLNVGKTGTVLGKTVAAFLDTIALDDGAKLSSTGDMTLTLAKLTLAGSGAAVLGNTDAGQSGTTKITTTDVLTNNGLLFSGHDLTVNAPSLTNATTGGIAALNNLNVTASTGDLMNQGALYAGNDLTAAATAGTLTNAAVGAIPATQTTPAIPAAYQGTIDSGNAITLNANTLVNNSTINAAADITITANTLRNEVAGGGDRIWVTSTPTTVMYDSQEWDGHNGYRQRWQYRDTWTVQQQYVTNPGLKAQLIAGATMNINFRDELDNKGGVISGKTVKLVGTGTNSKLVNDDLSLNVKTYKSNYFDYIHWQALVDASDKYNDSGWYPGACASGDDCYTGNDTVQSKSKAIVNGTWLDSENLVSSIGAGIFADTLTGSGFSLVNNGSTAVDASNIGAAKEGAAQTATVSSTDGKTPNSVSPSSTVGSSTTAFASVGGSGGVAPFTFGGITISLPTNPNGYFVTTRDPSAHYLVETNPLFLVGSKSLGSDYLARLLGYNPDTVGLLLGDASYEAYLVKQQLIAQTGNSVLAEYNGADAQMQGLMESAAGESKSLGLKYGQALSQAQQAKLTHDIVWMVSTEVDGKTVLAPVVYLAQSTKDNITSGAVISAKSADLSVTALTNVGGTLIGSDSFKVASVGDISNLSGLIKGGDVNLTSTEGSIVNETTAIGSGNASGQEYRTTIGKTAGIESTGNLTLDAKKDITNRGANMNAGKDASLKAGGDVTFDTVENKTTDTTVGNFKQGGHTGSFTSTQTTVNQVKSGLTTGGNLTVNAGNDITLAGTDAKVNGNADLDADGDINIVARENTSQTHSESRVAGFGVNNSLYGTTTTTTDTNSGRNVGSNFDVGGNANLKAGNDVTIQGSNVDVKGGGKIDATNVNVLAGQNYDNSTTTTKQTGILQVSASSSKSTDADASASASAKDGAASAAVSADASASGSGSAGLAFSSTTTTTDKKSDVHHVGSNVTFGGNLDVNAKNDVTLEGSTLTGGPETNVTAKNVNVLAAEDVSTSSHSVSHTSVGLLASTSNTAQAGASAGAGASGKAGLPSANANADANASVSSENRIDFVQTSKSQTDTLDTTHQGSTLGSGGTLTIKSDNLNVAGSSLKSGGDMTLDSKDQTFSAVNDRHETSSSSSATSAGLYLDASASADANASGTAGVGGAQGGASASANASGEAGIYGSNTRSQSVEGSTTAQTSSISAGGNLTRHADNNITDVGTQIDVGGDFNQSAKTITSQQAENTTYGSSSSATDTAKVGVYGSAGVSADVTGSVGPGASKPMTKSTDTGAGVRASYQHDDSSSQSATSTAVVSNIHVGGSMHSTSSGATTLEGTQIQAGKDVALEGGSIDYTAARNTSSSSDHSTSAGGSVGVDVVNKSVDVGVNYSGNKDSEQSSTAVVGGIAAGGNVSLKSGGDTRLEGTQISSGNSTDISTGGNFTFDAAKNTSSSSSQSTGVDVAVSVGKKAGSSSAGVGHGQSSSSHDEDVAGGISSGAGGIHINTGKDATFTGTQLDTQGGKVSVAAGGDLAFNAAHTVDHSESTGVAVSGSGSAGKKENVGGTRTGGMFSKKTGGQTMDERSGSGSLGVSTSKADSNLASGASIQTNGGNISLSSGGNTTLEGTQVAAGNTGSVSVAAGGDVIQKAAVSTSSSSGVDFSASGSGSSLTPTKGKGSTSAATNGTGTKGAGTGTAAKGAGSSGGGSTAGPTTKAGSGGATGNGGAGANKSPKTAEQLTQKKGSGVVTLGVDQKSTTKSSETTLSGGQGVTIISGTNNAAARQVSVSVPIANVPKGKTVQVKTADGKPMPSWLKLDPKTGKISGKPPADFKGDLKLAVSIPQADGTTKTVPIDIKGGQQ